MTRPLKIIVLGALLAAVALPGTAVAGTAISVTPNLPSGAGSGGPIQVGQVAAPGDIVIIQTFNGIDLGATSRLNAIRLAPSCGPGPSPGNPSTSGPAINSPEVPCTNPDLGVFGGLSVTATGAQSCAGISFSITPPDSNGQVELIPSAPVFLRHADECAITFTFSVLAAPTKDTFPNAPGIQTTSVASVRSQVVANPLNPFGVGLQAAGIGSGNAVLIEPDPDCSDTPTAPQCVTNCTTNPSGAGCADCKTNPSAAGCATTRAAKAADPQLRLAGTCVRKRIRASVTGEDITKVAYLLDKRRLRVVKGGSPFNLNVVRALRAGSHKLTATITFSSGRPTQKITRRLARCRDPKFTG